MVPAHLREALRGPGGPVVVGWLVDIVRMER